MLDRQIYCPDGKPCKSDWCHHNGKCELETIMDAQKKAATARHIVVTLESGDEDRFALTEFVKLTDINAVMERARLNSLEQTRRNAAEHAKLWAGK